MTAAEDAFDRLLLMGSLLQADQARFHERHGMSAARVHLLWQVGTSGPVPQRAVADALGISPRAVTGLVDGLEASGHVRRRADPHDRRAALVTLTGQGEGFVKELKASHAALAAALFGEVGPEMLAAFTEVLDRAVSTFSALMEEEL